MILLQLTTTIIIIIKDFGKGSNTFAKNLPEIIKSSTYFIDF